MVLLFTSTATVIFEDPIDVTVEPNVWANFSCTVHCSFQKVMWYKVGRSNVIENLTGASIDGLQFNIPSKSMCTSGNKTTYFLEVLATRQSHNSAFYCAAYETCFGCPETECKCGCVGSCYSRPAFLKGKPVMLYLDFSVVPSLVLLPFKSHSGNDSYYTSSHSYYTTYFPRYTCMLHSMLSVDC